MARTYGQDRAAWVAWLRIFGAGRFYDAFMRNAQGAESTCRYCGERITLDIREGGGVTDWGQDGEYGCPASPETTDDGCGGHLPIGNIASRKAESAS